MNNALWRRLATLAATAGLIASLGFVGTVAPALAADSCSGPGFTLGAECTYSGTHALSGTLTFDETLHLLNPSILNTSAANTTITVTSGNLVMEKNAQITGGGKNITINVLNGDMLMKGTAGTTNCGYPATPAASLGAQITSKPATLATTITINVGNYPNSTSPQGSFTMERCSLVDVSRAGGSAGTVKITAGHDADIDGLVLSESTLTGTSNQAPGGGPISVQTGCVLRVSSTGVVSSKGSDPGADLVHLEGCDVFIDGLVQSTGAGHSTPTNPANHCATGVHSGKPANSTACLEIIGQNITVSTTGEVNANDNSTGSGGPQGTSWIDLYAYLNITINGKTGATDKFSVHADSLSGTDTTPNTITALAGASLQNEPGTLTASGKAISASDTANGSYGGTVNIGAAGVAPTGAVILNGATIQAAGDNSGAGAPCDSGSGACGRGGFINVQSFHDRISWTSGVGNVNPDKGVSPPAGKITLTACTTFAPGATFGDAAPVPATGVCIAPTVPGYITAAFNVGDPIWDACTFQGGSPAITTTATAGPVTVGAKIHDVAHLSGGVGTITGSILFTVYAPGDTTCATPLTPALPPVPVNQVAPGSQDYTSADFTTTAVGTYRWIAAFTDTDGNNASVTTACNDANESSAVQRATPAITTTATAGPVTVGAKIHDVAHLSGGVGTITGSILFTVYAPGDTTCATPLTPALPPVPVNQVAPGSQDYTSADFTTTAVGTYRWIAAFTDTDGNNASVTTACNDANESSAVQRATPAITTTATAGPVTVGAKIHDVAHLSGGVGTITGSILFTVYAPGDTTCATPLTPALPPVPVNQVAPGSQDYTSADFTTTAVGTYRWIAAFTDTDGNNASVTTACNDANESSAVVAPSGQITPTQTTCDDIRTGTSATLSELNYSIQNGEVQAVNPGVFFYWITVTAAAGSNTFTITQTQSDAFPHFFDQASGSFAWNSGCVKVTTQTITTSNGVTTVNFTAASAGTFYIGIKYDSKSVEGFTAPAGDVDYTFSTGGVPGSSQHIILKHP